VKNLEKVVEESEKRQMIRLSKFCTALGIGIKDMADDKVGWAIPYKDPGQMGALCVIMRKILGEEKKIIVPGMALPKSN